MNFFTFYLFLSVGLVRSELQVCFNDPMSLKMSSLDYDSDRSRSRRTSSKENIPADNQTDELYFQRKIEELRAAGETYGKVDNMPSVTLNNGVKMPVLALGSALTDPKLTSSLVKAALDLGYRHLDCAYVYGTESYIGEALTEKLANGDIKRDELFVSSKLWSTFHRADLVERACRDSLERLGLDYLDLFMIHLPMSFKEGPDAVPKIANVMQYSTVDYLETWFAMEELLKTGLVRSIGVSNFNSQQLSRLMEKGRVKPAVNQVECHPYLNQARLSAFCDANDIQVSCYGTLGSRGTPAAYRKSGPAPLDDPVVLDIAAKLGVTPAQVLIRYQLDRDHTVVFKTSSAARMWENLQALRFRLSSAQIQALDTLNKNRRHFTYQGMGDTHKNYPFNAQF